MRTKTGLHGKTHRTADGNVKRDVPKVLGEKQGNLKGMKRLLPGTEELVESVSGQGDGMRFAGSLQVRHRRPRQPTHEGCVLQLLGKRDKGFGKETWRSTLKFVQAHKASACGRTLRKK